MWPTESHEEGPPAESCSVRPLPDEGRPTQCCTSDLTSAASASTSTPAWSAGSCSSAEPSPPDGDGLAGLVRRLGDAEVLAVIESMNGARFVHDRLELHRWDVRIADPL